MKEIPSCFFPTTVICLDDDRGFLDSLAIKLPMTHAVYRFFDKPVKMLRFMNEEYMADPFVKHTIKRPDSFVVEQRNVDINIGALSQEIYNPQRFNQVSVIVLDYDMPGMNGLEVCKKIKDPYVQKILLTGAADESLAVEAFNQGLIHKFITKQSKGMADLLEQAIAEGQMEYFRRLSQLVLDAVLNSPDEPSALSDYAFIRFFEKYIEKAKPVEFYLIEGLGSLLFLDALGKPTGLFLKTKDQMQAVHIEAKDEELIPLDLKAAIRDFKKILCFQASPGQAFPQAEEWTLYSQDAFPLPGNEDYYYGISSRLNQIDLSKIYSFKAFKEDFYKNGARGGT